MDLVGSMGQVDASADNAAMESFFVLVQRTSWTDSGGPPAPASGSPPGSLDRADLPSAPTTARPRPIDKTDDIRTTISHQDPDRTSETSGMRGRCVGAADQTVDDLGAAVARAAGVEPKYSASRILRVLPRLTTSGIGLVCANSDATLTSTSRTRQPNRGLLGLLTIREVLSTGAQDVPDPLERVVLASTVAVDLLLGPATNAIDDSHGELNDMRARRTPSTTAMGSLTGLYDLEGLLVAGGGRYGGRGRRLRVVPLFG